MRSMVIIVIWMSIPLLGIKPSDIHHRSAYVTRSFNTHKSYIAFMKDRYGFSYLIKQNTKRKKGFFTLNSQFKMIREVYGSSVMRYLGIRGHDVCLVPVGVQCPGKKFPEILTTMHSIVPGVTLSKSPYRHAFIKQWSPGKGSSKNKLGLSMDVIHGMAMHEELPFITALDTFTANNDRSRNNLFWEEKKKQFHVIDMDCSLSCNLAELACEQVRLLKRQGYKKLTSRELAALQHYRSALCYYVDTCPLKMLYELFDTLCQQGGFTKGGYFKDGLHLVRHYRAVIGENYKSILELIDLLKEVTDPRCTRLARFV